MRQKPMRLTQIWNMCFGFFGIQVAFALQNANTSRIFQTLGADVDRLAILWIAAPATGLLVQPVIGYLSDRTRGRLGRRRPYFLGGSILAAAALLFMPHAPSVWAAAIGLWMMDASINVAMEPFRAFVGDLLPEEQRSTGFAMQSFFIGAGAVLASLLPALLTLVLHVSNQAPRGQIPPSVRLAFEIGAAALLVSVLWTVVSTPEQQISVLEPAPEVDAEARRPGSYWRWSAAGLGAGLLAAAVIAGSGGGRELYVLAAIAAGFGLLQFTGGLLRSFGRPGNGITAIADDIVLMPEVMRGLAVVQFFSWFGLFALWIYATPSVTFRQFGTLDTASAGFARGADYVSVLFSVYNGVAALAAFLLPTLAARIGRRQAHAAALVAGGVGLLSFHLFKTPGLLILSMVGVGVAWSSILAAPYSILSGAAPPQKMGVYMGIFNIFIVLPQLLAASALGLLVRRLFGGDPSLALAAGGVSLVLGAAFSLGLKDAADPRASQKARMQPSAP